MVKKLPLDKFNEIYSQVTRLSVEVIISGKDGVLLTKRSINPYKGYWHITGGTVLFGETISEAVKRVVKEELGMKVRKSDLIGYIEYPNESKMGDYPRWTIGLAMLTDLVLKKVSKNTQGEEISFFMSAPKKTLPEQIKFLRKYFTYLR